MGDDEKGLRGTRGARCRERRTRREERMGNLLNASIMSGIMNGRDKDTELKLSLTVIYTRKGVLNHLSLKPKDMNRINQ